MRDFLVVDYKNIRKKAQFRQDLAYQIYLRLLLFLILIVVICVKYIIIILKRRKMGTCLVPKQQNSQKKIKTIVIDLQRAATLTKSVNIWDNQIDAVIRFANSLRKKYLLNEKQKAFSKKFMENHYFFNQLQNQEIEEYINSLYKIKLQPNEQVFRVGSIGNQFYFIYEGLVAIKVQDTTITTLSTGQFFGQLALLYSLTRNASAQCTTPSELIVMPSKQFNKAVRENNFKNCQKIKKIINKIQLLDFLNEHQKSSMVRHSIKVEVKGGHVIFNSNDPATCLYLVESGSVKLDIPGSTQIVIKSGEFFGQGCFNVEPFRKGKAVALQNCVLFTISKLNMQKCLGQNFQRFIYAHVRKWSLAKNPIFSNYNKKNLDIINSFFTVQNGQQGEVIQSKGYHPAGFIICLQGEINGKGPGSMFCQQYFGKPNLTLKQDIIHTKQGQFSFLDFRKFQRLKKQLQYSSSNRISDVKSTISKNLINSQRQNMLLCRNKDKPLPWVHNLETLMKVYEDEISLAFLVKNPKIIATFFLIKVLDKQKIIRQDRENRVSNEKQVAQRVSHPNIIGYVNSFVDKYNIYMMYEFIHSVKLREVMKQTKIQKTLLKYYIAAILQTVNYLHQKNIIHRNIKPETIAITHEGKVLFDNLNSSRILKDISGRTYTIIGTPHYMAPQIFQGKGYSREVDFWAIGVLLYQIYFGKFPFGNNCESPFDVIKQIAKNAPNFKCQGNDKDITQFINRLMIYDPIQRNPGNMSRLMKMNFLADFEWNKEALLRKIVHIPKKFRTQTINLKQLRTSSLISQIQRQKLKKGIAKAQIANTAPIVWTDYII